MAKMNLMGRRRQTVIKYKRRTWLSDMGVVYPEREFGIQPFFIQLQIGYGLIPLVDKEKGGVLLKVVSIIKNMIDAHYGIQIPMIRIRDNLSLEPYDYSISLYGTEAGSGSVRLGYVLLLPTEKATIPFIEIKGDRIKEPVYGNDAIWVSEDHISEYKEAGYKSVNPENIMGQHLQKIILENRLKIFDQSMVNTLINKVRPTNPDVIDDIFFYHQFTTSSMKKILNCLLEENYSIRDMNTILEVIADNIDQSQEPEFLAAKVKEHLPLAIEIEEGKWYGC